MDDEAWIESDEDDSIQVPKNNQLKISEIDRGRFLKMELMEQEETRNGIVRNDFRPSSDLV